ncbi:hypothetical protein ACFU7D_19800 [Nocardioides sp. NPDC057577]|uniref:hypothetical protein n=1 Tax=Nocardioides sp. NPDC057577 TaxID=3346171 RepID=UPI00366CF412
MTSWRLVAAAAAAAAACALTACNAISYGAEFGYPEAAPVPDGVEVVATDKGWDDDDPLRSRQQVLELGDMAQADLIEFYQAAYPASEGWTEGEASDPEQLCLVNDADPGYTEVVETYQYEGDRVRVSPTRRLVTVSRIKDPDPEVCGVALAWINVDLFTRTRD